ncbi:MAG: metallophosphoesterase [Pseudomonadota bacterium]
MEPDRVYAIGDIHGQLEALRAVHAAIDEDLKASPVASHAILHIGDFVDRGPDMPGTLDYMAAGMAAGAPWINLMGNHDRMFLRYLEEPGGQDPVAVMRGVHWRHPKVGGFTTISAYGVPCDAGPAGPLEDRSLDEALHAPLRDAVPEAHRRFLESLRSHWRWRDVFFVHAGVHPGTPLVDQFDDDLIWIRTPFLTSRLDHGALIVHGHTPVERVEDHGNRIAIDTGAAYGGPLSCVVFDDTGVRILGGDRLR